MGIGFNTQEQKAAGTGSGLPISDDKGWPIRIIDFELVADDAEKPPFLKYHVEMLPGTQYAGNQYDISFFIMAEDVRGRIAREELTACCYAGGYVGTIEDGPEIVNRELRVVVYEKKGKVDSEGNVQTFINKAFLTLAGEKPTEAEAHKLNQNGGGGQPNQGQPNQQVNQNQNQGQPQQQQQQQQQQPQVNQNQGQNQNQNFNPGNQPNQGDQGNWSNGQQQNNGNQQQQNPNQVQQQNPQQNTNGQKTPEWG